MSGVARWTAALAWLTHPVYVVAGMPMSWGDMAGFLTGIVNVWLAARAHVWNFHFGILNAAILGLVFLQQRLFADASLQVVFIVLNLRGLLQWRAGHTVRESDPVFRLAHGELLVHGGCGGLHLEAGGVQPLNDLRGRHVVLLG